MARVTGAAASGLVLVVLLMSVAFGAAQPQPQGILAQLFAAWFPQGSLPPPVRIYCRQDAALNVAVRDGKVVLANANCSDLSQKWFPLYTLFSFLGPVELKPFSLVNAQTFQVITIPSGSGQQVGLSGPFDGPRAAREELWTPAKPTRDDGFYQLFVTKDTRFTLNGLLGGVRVGTEVGIYRASPDSENALWKVTSSWPTCFP